ncbi:hypothetical protein SBA1_1190015 [Candidatus Sulfotelmatobacter kueseliae]|uniref:Uncharacterized protein n=1 Tax=Candidatus Sulfotelmatobacter kueseliae TaxID=2042962 RepID=A0A2U3K1G0_9BACT|nr:hypothetical protein SBA1_1190015 [Candidatus Sulfotelmatobacter kueseliae]
MSSRPHNHVDPAASCAVLVTRRPEQLDCLLQESLPGRFFVRLAGLSLLMTPLRCFIFNLGPKFWTLCLSEGSLEKRDSNANLPRDRGFAVDGHLPSRRRQCGFNQAYEPKSSFLVGALAAEARGQWITGSVTGEFAAAVGIALRKMAGSRSLLLF